MASLRCLGWALGRSNRAGTRWRSTTALARTLELSQTSLTRRVELFEAFQRRQQESTPTGNGMLLFPPSPPLHTPPTLMPLPMSRIGPSTFARVFALTNYHAPSLQFLLPLLASLLHTHSHCLQVNVYGFARSPVVGSAAQRLDVCLLDDAVRLRLHPAHSPRIPFCPDLHSDTSSCSGGRCGGWWERWRC